MASFSHRGNKEKTSQKQHLNLNILSNLVFWIKNTVNILVLLLKDNCTEQTTTPNSNIENLYWWPPGRCLIFDLLYFTECLQQQITTRPHPEDFLYCIICIHM